MGGCRERRQIQENVTETEGHCRCCEAEGGSGSLKIRYAGPLNGRERGENLTVSAQSKWSLKPSDLCHMIEYVTPEILAVMVR